MIRLSALKNLFSSRDEDLPAANWLIVGLGNPGPQYESTRHNVGFLTLDRLMHTITDNNDGILRPVPAGPGIKADLSLWKLHGSCSVLLVRPLTFMNLSGEAVAPLCQRLGIACDHVIVIHDELDLPPAAVKLRSGGSENGHNGLKSLTQHLGAPDYLRVRIGIGRPTDQGTSITDHVLEPIELTPAMEHALNDAARACRLIITEGLAKAQNVVHQKKR